ncbi:MAG: hypothetical protein M0Z49_07260 [Chloroflexi bacterium]|nr:hypothetical protein [Chloroflexota bacterium]
MAHESAPEPKVRVAKKMRRRIARLERRVRAARRDEERRVKRLEQARERRALLEQRLAALRPSPPPETVAAQGPAVPAAPNDGAASVADEPAASGQG